MGYNYLAYFIIRQAIRDYREFRWDKRRIAELKEFFESEWCDFLLQKIKLTGRDILRELEDEVCEF